MTSNINAVHYPEVPKGHFDIAVIICPNGAGHHKRVFGALDLILKAKPEAKVIVFADRSVTEKFIKDFEPLQRIAANNGVKFVFGVVSPGLDIMAKDPTVYTNGQWLNWVNRLVPYRSLIQNAKLVWADALPQMLMLRPDAIFSSSFTFGPVIESMWGNRDDQLGQVSRLYAKQEELLMKACLPTYVTVGILTMEFMKVRALVKEVGVMADFRPVEKQVNPGRPAIGVRGGLTGLAGKILEQTVSFFLKKDKYELHVDKVLAEKFPGLTVLGFTAKDYAPLTFNICRPGAGEVTNSVTSSTPIIAISEPDNLEMEWNGRNIQANGLGFQVRSPEEAYDTIANNIISEEWWESYSTARSRISINGLGELADIVLSRLRF